MIDRYCDDHRAVGNLFNNIESLRFRCPWPTVFASPVFASERTLDINSGNRYDRAAKHIAETLEAPLLADVRVFEREKGFMTTQIVPSDLTEAPISGACSSGSTSCSVGDVRTDLKDLPENYLLHRRFDRIGRLLGDQTMSRIYETHAMVLGLGGVGSWAAESLVRSGVGKVTIVDFDLVCVTNINRQLHAMHGVIGRKKVEVMADRLKKINPKCVIEVVDQFYNDQTAEEILSRNPDVVLDAIDNVTAKCHLLATCVAKGIPVITAGGSGARLDPTQVRVVDLGETHTDPLFWAVRRVLRTKYGFQEGKLGIPAVFSAEVPIEPEELKYDEGKGFRCVCPNGSNEFHSCEKRNKIYGTAGFVTGTFGFVMASWVVKGVKDQTLGRFSRQN